MKKKEQMSLPDESNFDPQLSQLLQLLNPWMVALWDDCEHI
jgi:hypothetical protein